MNIPIKQWSGADATEALHDTVKEYNEVATAQAKAMIKLTRWIIVLTIALLLGLALQVWIALQPTDIVGAAAAATSLSM